MVFLYSTYWSFRFKMTVFKKSGILINKYLININLFKNSLKFSITLMPIFNMNNTTLINLNLYWNIVEKNVKL